MIAKIISSAFLLVLAAIAFVISYRQYKKRGYIFTNTWAWASKKQRAVMDEKTKETEYLLARNVFFILGVASLSFSFFAFTGTVVPLIAGLASFVFVAVYAVVWAVRHGSFK